MELLMQHKANLRQVRSDGTVPALFPLQMDLREFKMRVSRWANAHPSRYRTLLWVLGSCIDLETGVVSMRLETIERKFQSALDRQGRGEVAPRGRTIKRMLAELRGKAMVAVEQSHPRQQAWTNKTHWGANRYLFDLEHVVVKAADGTLQRKPHNFMAPFEPRDIPGQPENLAPSLAHSSTPDRPTHRPASQSVVSSSSSLDPVCSQGRPATPTAEPLAAWWPSAVDQAALVLEEMFRSRVDRGTLGRKWAPALDYVADQEELLEILGDYLEHRPGLRQIGGAIAYFVEWLEAACYTLQERAEIDAEEQAQEAQRTAQAKEQAQQRAEAESRAREVRDFLAPLLTHRRVLSREAGGRLSSFDLDLKWENSAAAYAYLQQHPESVHRMESRLEYYARASD